MSSAHMLIEDDGTVRQKSSRALFVAESWSCHDWTRVMSWKSSLQDQNVFHPGSGKTLWTTWKSRANKHTHWWVTCLCQWKTGVRDTFCGTSLKFQTVFFATETHQSATLLRIHGAVFILLPKGWNMLECHFLSSVIEVAPRQHHDMLWHVLTCFDPLYQPLIFQKKVMADTTFDIWSSCIIRWSLSTSQHLPEPQVPAGTSPHALGPGASQSSDRCPLMIGLHTMLFTYIARAYFLSHSRRYWNSGNCIDWRNLWINPGSIAAASGFQRAMSDRVIRETSHGDRREQDDREVVGTPMRMDPDAPETQKPQQTDRVPRMLDADGLTPWNASAFGPLTQMEAGARPSALTSGPPTSGPTLRHTQSAETVPGDMETEEVRVTEEIRRRAVEMELRDQRGVVPLAATELTEFSRSRSSRGRKAASSTKASQASKKSCSGPRPSSAGTSRPWPGAKGKRTLLKAFSGRWKHHLLRRRSWCQAPLQRQQPGAGDARGWSSHQYWLQQMLIWWDGAMSSSTAFCFSGAGCVSARGALALS